MCKMAKNTIFLINASILVAVASCFFMPLIVSGARAVWNTKFVVEGKVFCDTCCAGFETPATTYISGAKVRVECRTRSTHVKTCSFDGVTDETGTYKIPVSDEHEYEICESVLVESPDNACHKIVMGRERAQVFLTSHNGIISDVRYANAMGFQKDTPLAFCAELMKQYEDVDV